MNRNPDNPMAIGAADAYERSQAPIPESCWRQARELVLGDMDTFTDWLVGEGNEFTGGKVWEQLHLLLTTSNANAMGTAIDYLVEQYLTDKAGYLAAEARDLANGEAA